MIIISSSSAASCAPQAARGSERLQVARLLSTFGGDRGIKEWLLLARVLCVD
jgi:hypothetical protein